MLQNLSWYTSIEQTNQVLLNIIDRTIQMLFIFTRKKRKHPI